MGVVDGTNVVVAVVVGGSVGVGVGCVGDVDG